MKQATSFQLDIVSNPTDANAQMIQLTLWAIDTASPSQPLKYTQLISTTDSSVQSLLIEYNKLLSSLKIANGVS